MKIRRIASGEGSQMKAIRIAAFTDTAEAFGSTLEIARALPDEEYEARTRTAAAGRERMFLVAQDDDGGWVGMVAGFDEGDRVELLSMWVAPAHRRRGIGRALVDALLEWAAAGSAREVYLFVGEGNEPARAFYSSLGFAPTGTKKTLAWNASIPEIEMARRTIMTTHDPYILGYRRAEQERLQRQAQELAAESTWLFDQIGVSPGALVVEIGCGPQGCLPLLSERVGPSGRVVGVERSEDAVELARTLITDRGLTNVEVVCRDARATELPRAAFDLATARLVLVNVPEPEQIVAEAVALVRPGGHVAFHEADWIAQVCDPPSDAWTTFVELFVTYSEKNGIDPYIGRKGHACCARPVSRTFA